MIRFDGRGRKLQNNQRNVEHAVGKTVCKIRDCGEVLMQSNPRSLTFSLKSHRQKILVTGNYDRAADQACS